MDASVAVTYFERQTMFHRLRAYVRLLPIPLLSLACSSPLQFPDSVECDKTSDAILDVGAEVLRSLLSGGDKQDWLAIGREHGPDALACGTQIAIDELSKPGASEESIAARAKAVEYLKSTGTEVR